MKTVEQNGQVLRTYNWNKKDRLNSIVYNGGATNNFAYNGVNARIYKQDNTGTYNFKRSGIGVTAPVLSDSAAQYLPGISESRGGVSKFMHSGIKNANMQTDSIQFIAATQRYDAFGNCIAYTGSWSGPFGYGGHFGYQTDSDSGLLLLGHRYYDPSIGRFISRDIAKDGRNWYVYCRNNPIVSADPAGLLVARPYPETYPDLYAFIRWLLDLFPFLDFELRIENGQPSKDYFPTPQQFMGKRFLKESLKLLPKGVSAVLGTGMTLLDAGLVLGKGIGAVGGWVKRVRAGYREDFEQAGKSWEDQWKIRYWIPLINPCKGEIYL
ncbi:MAG TPA: RHS repeat-associated core domain-containing protein [Fimbriimonadales bacterium]|nr:RHS repeat-associated core domain-containing protein [Fimbriimonadales bacterium]